ncbi:MAG TPA: hypothetical protein VFE88_03210 [Candidatus Nanoarchaeia archaeon]|nr:hypothetical protein [Candidatus Nanoarchaeia archaeon]
MPDDVPLERRIKFLTEISHLLRYQQFLRDSVSYSEGEKREIFERRMREAIESLKERYGSALEGTPEAEYWASIQKYEKVMYDLKKVGT